MVNRILVISAIVLTILAFEHQLSFSQLTQQWVARYNGSANQIDRASKVITDKFGNVFVTGASNGVGADEDYLTVKYSSTGAQLWEARYNGPGNEYDIPEAITVDKKGNVYVTGSSHGVGTGPDYLTIKYNSNGVQQWMSRYNGPGNSSDNASSIVVDESGYVYITGAIRAENGYAEFGTIKYDSMGVRMWLVRYSGQVVGSDYGSSLAIDSLGFVYVTGYSRSTTSNPNFDYATIKYSPAGGQQWVSRYNGNSNLDDRPTSISVDRFGSVVVTGYSHVGYTEYKCLTIKYNSIGELQWAAKYEPQFGYPKSLATDILGNVYITGVSADDYLTIKYNSEGTQQWVANYNGMGNSFDEANGIVLDRLGNVYVTGSSMGLITQMDYVTLKYDSNGNQLRELKYNGPQDSIDYGNSIAIDSSGNIYVTGASKGIGSDFDYATIKYSAQEPPIRINVKVSFEGMYYPVFNLLSRRDTVKAYLVNSISPYNVIDSSNAIIDSVTLSGVFTFANAPSGVYFIVLKHFNSIETWSRAGGTLFVRSNIENVYDFTSGAAQAYGSNQTLKGSKYCIYTGDINQSGFIDGSDAIRVHSDSRIFLTGRYLPTDLNADGIVDGTDYLMVDNNAYYFIGRVVP